MKSFSINLLDLVLSFTQAMDVVSTDLKNHHKRVTTIAVNIAKEMGITGKTLFDIEIAARLHDIGAVSVTERHMLTTLEFDSNFAHAVQGYKILKDFRQIQTSAYIILHHHRKWRNGEGRTDRNQNEVHIGSWIIHLADRIDIVMKHDEYPLSQKDEVIRKLKPFFGEVFKPDVADAFLALSEKEYFWLDIAFKNDADSYSNCFLSTDENANSHSLIEIGQVFSQIIDFRNRFTSTHSAGVSASAVALTKFAGYDEDMQDQMRVAGFLHDLGKIAVPVGILNKDGALTQEERLIINSHTYHTFSILRHVKGLENINRWASFHHEKLDGSGYPFHLKADQLDKPSRIMMFADIFTALTEDRPYRAGMQRKEVCEVFNELVSKGKLDGEIFKLLLSNYDILDEERRIGQAEAIKKYEDVFKPEKTDG